MTTEEKTKALLEVMEMMDKEEIKALLGGEGYTKKEVREIMELIE